MRSMLLTVLAMVVGLLVVAGPMFAHHSDAIYDRENPVTLKGTVTEFRFFNPHIQILFEIKDENGKVVKWIASTGTPTRMFRRGWSKTTLKPGDEITVTGTPAKNGRKVMRLTKLVGPTGKVLRDVAA